jgi:hypothetical protein
MGGGAPPVRTEVPVPLAAVAALAAAAVGSTGPVPGLAAVDITEIEYEAESTQEIEGGRSEEAQVFW